MIVVEISSRSEDVGPKPIAVVAVLYVLGTILLPLQRRVSRANGARAEPPPSGPPTASDMGVLRLDHVVVAVNDWERADAFYRGVLGAERIDGPDGCVTYRVGEQRLNVHGPGTPAAPLPQRLVQPGGSGLCFVWNGSISEAVEHMRQHAVDIVAGPTTRIGAYGPGQSIYFNDPDGSLIELISYG